MQQWMVPVDTAVDYADRWRILACQGQPTNEVLDPLRLLHSVVSGQKLSGIVWPAKLSEIIQDIDSGTKLLHSSLKENDRPVPESEALPPHSQSGGVGKSPKTFGLMAIPATQPHLPPYGLPGGRELLRRIGPQRLAPPWRRQPHSPGRTSVPDASCPAWDRVFPVPS